MSEIKNYEKCQKAVELAHNIDNSHTTLAKLLKEIRDLKAYQPQYSNFKEWLQEIDMSEGTASRLITTYEVLVEKYNLSEDELKKIGWSKAYEIKRHTNTKEQAQEYLLKAQNWTRNDLKEQIRVDNGGKEKNECEHEMQSFDRCKKCGVWDKK